MINTLFKQKVLAMQDYLMNFACMLTSDRDEARDLLQDTTLKVLDNESKYVEDTNFKGWMSTIMRNIFINNYRKRKRQPTMVDQTDDLYHINLSEAAVRDTPEDTYSTKEILEILATFSDAYRVPFIMHVEGYKYVEISEHMHLPVGTVKSRIFFARRRLRALLGGYRD